MAGSGTRDTRRARERMSATAECLIQNLRESAPGRNPTCCLSVRRHAAVVPGPPHTFRLALIRIRDRGRVIPACPRFAPVIPWFCDQSCDAHSGANRAGASPSVATTTDASTGAATESVARSPNRPRVTRSGPSTLARRPTPGRMGGHVTWAAWYSGAAPRTRVAVDRR